MNKILAALSGIMITGMAVLGQANTTNFTFDVNQSIPDGNPTGLTLTTNLAGFSGAISSLTVSLDITGGYNGDLYAYLAGPDGGFAVLLNRVGVGSDDLFGYADSGFNITLDDSALNNIHFYQNDGYTLSDGQLTGTWQPDGRNIDPESSLGNFDSAPATSSLFSFNGTDANGTWTLFLADLSSGNQSTIVDWGLGVTTIAVPEPSTFAIIFCGGFLFAIVTYRKTYRRKII